MGYIGLDVGTTGCKASVINNEGRILAYRYKEYNLLFPEEGWVEINADTVWESVCNVLRGIRDECNCRINALAIASFGEALVLLDENDNVLDNSIFYSDVRGNDETKELALLFEKDKLQGITGMPLNSMYSINKLMWIKKNRPDIYNKARKIMLFGDYISYKLSGERKIDFSLASRTMAFDIHRKYWAENIFDSLDIDKKKFSEPVLAGCIVGTVREKIAEELNLPKDMYIVGGGHDQACAALGAGIIEAGDAVDGIGTAECITLVMDKTMIKPEMYNFNYCCEPYICKDKYISLIFNVTSGAAIKWYRDTFENERHKVGQVSGESIYKILDRECSSKPSPLFFLPHLAGSGTPFMDSLSSGAILGLKLSSSKSDIYKAILEGICFEMMFNIDVLRECGIKLDQITAVGGGARSSTLLQIKSDIMNMPVRTLSTKESGTLGLAILCSVACGDYKDIKSAVKSIVVVDKTYYPRNEYVEKYKEKYEVYKRIYPALKGIFNTN